MIFCRTIRCAALASFCLLPVLPLLAQVTLPAQFVVPTGLSIDSSTYPSSNFSGNLGTVDFNGDGRTDILVYSEINGSAPQYAVLFANSDGSYTPRLTGIAVRPAFPDTAIAADVDGDGLADIVTISTPQLCAGGAPCGPFTLNIYLGNGDGSFRTGATHVSSTAAFATLLAVRDMNGDGKPDLVINSGPISGGSGTITVWTNQGGGSFTPGESYQGLPPLAYGDFNGDGYTDLVIPGLQILLSNQGTSFQTGSAYPIPNNLFPYTQSAIVGDMNHDHTLDIVASDSFGIDHILIGLGDGTFRAGANFSPLAGFQSAGVLQTLVSLADVTGDGNPDITLTAAASTGNLLMVYPGNGTGSVGFPTTYNVGFGSADLIDRNRNGNFDVLVVNSPKQPRSLAPSGYALAINDGKGNFHAPRETFAAPHLAPGPPPASLATADFNHDGKSDVAVLSDAMAPSGRGTVLVFAGSGKGYLGVGTSYSVLVPFGVLAAGDVNGDGKIDLVVARDARYLLQCSCTPAADLSVLLGNGDGTFQPAKNFRLLGMPAAGDYDDFVALADVNHDGVLDVIGDWGVALGKGNGEFGVPIPLPASLSNIYALAVGDFNGDGFPDLAVSVQNVVTPLPALTYAGVAYVLMGDGKGAFTIKGEVETPNTTFVGALAVADMNGDGKADIVFDDYQSSSRTLIVALGNGDGTFPTAIDYPLDPGSSPFTSMVVGDFNRDGKPDLLLGGYAYLPGASADGPLTLLYGIGGGALSSTPRYYQTALGLVSGSSLVLDLNSDHAPDIIGISSTGVTRLLNTGSRTVVAQ